MSVIKLGIIDATNRLPYYSELPLLSQSVIYKLCKRIQPLYGTIFHHGKEIHSAYLSQ